MLRIKLIALGLFIMGVVFACSNGARREIVISDSKAYEASIFRQRCAICHGAEADGKTLEDGTKVPSLRTGDFKAKTEAQIYSQIRDGGNGMTPFRGQLTDNEIRSMTRFVYRDLRGN